MEITSTNVLVVILIVVLICCFIVWMNESNDSQSSDGGNNVIVSTHLDKEGNIILIPGRSSDPQTVNGMTLIGLYGNEDNQELIDSIPVYGNDGKEYSTLFSVKVDNIKKGDAFYCTASYSAAVDQDYNTNIVTQIYVSTTKDHDGTVDEVTEASGSNRNHDIHYFTVPKIGWWVADKNYDTLYFNTGITAASNNASDDLSDIVRIKQDYGRMTVAQFRSV